MQADVIIVGGGIAGGTVAWRLASTDPSLRILLFEKGDCLSDRQSWPFISPPLDDPWFQKLIVKSWTSFDTRFSHSDRTIPLSFYFLRSERFYDILRTTLGKNLIINTEIEEISDSHVKTKSGVTFRAPLVIDATGIHSEDLDPKLHRFTKVPCGWMKYIGLDLKVTINDRLHHSWFDLPTAFDARIPQSDGFRSFMTVPLEPGRVYVQETYLSANPRLNIHRTTRSILAYVQRLGWQIDYGSYLLREESGITPLPLYKLDPLQRTSSASQLRNLTSAEDFIQTDPIKISSFIGLYHHSLGYGVADSIRIADFIAKAPSLRTGPIRAALRDFLALWTSHQANYQAFNRMVIKATDPAFRHIAYENLFSHKEDLLGRFFTGELTNSDLTKIFATRPPLRSGKIYRDWASEKWTEPHSSSP